MNFISYSSWLRPYTAQIYDGTDTLLQQKCHHLGFTTDSHTFEGNTLAVQSASALHQYVHRGPRFDSRPHLEQIFVNFTTNMSYFSQITSINSLQQFIAKLLLEYD